MSSTDWEARAAAKRDEVNALIPEAWRLHDVPPAEQVRDISGTYLHQFLSSQEVEITEALAETILSKTTTGQWKAEDVIRAFAHRAALVHQYTNCLHEIFFDAGIEDAKKLDEYFAKNGKPVGPLHGLPVSLKDQFHARGVETHMGYIGWLGTFQGKKGTGKEKVFESEMVRELRNLGALLYCKTSVPHTLMAGETVNNIIRFTCNPRNRLLGSGGSSGGEGALISGKGSPLGFGTDIGGSIRIPAASCGLFGIRPSTGRLPYEGMANSMDGQNSILSVVGPLSSSIGGLNIAVRALLSQQPWFHDPRVHDIPWREDKFAEVGADAKDGRLSFAILWHDDEVQPFPPIKRALKAVVDAMKKQGHTVIDWKPPSHSVAGQIAGTIWQADGNADVLKAFELSGEPILEGIMVGRTLEPQFNAEQIMAANIMQREYEKEYMEYWNSTAAMTGTGRPVDAVIMPAAPFPAARRSKYKYYNYTLFANVIDYTSVIIPVTKVDKNVDGVDTAFKPLNDLDQDVQNDYDPEIYDGAAVSVQLLGRRLQEEKMLALAEYVSGMCQQSSATA